MKSEQEKMDSQTIPKKVPTKQATSITWGSKSSGPANPIQSIGGLTSKGPVKK